MSPSSSRIRGAIACLVALSALATVLPAATATSPRPATSTTVLDVYQTPNRISPFDSFSVFLELTSTANIQQVYFTFCQLSSSRCYLPISMGQINAHWFEGSTKSMTQYPGMVAGVTAGYNITIVYNDTTTQTEPAIPNQFTNLTIAQSVTGEYMYEMAVAPLVFGLTGKVFDSSTGAAISGATVTLSAPNTTSATTDSAGDYTIAGIVNGTYTITVTKAGYRTSQTTVGIQGRDTSQNLSMASTSSSPPPSSGAGTFSGFLGLGAVASLALIGVVIVALLLVVVMAARRRRPPPLASSPGPATGAPPSTEAARPPG